MKNPIYLDGFATLPLDPEVRSTILDVWQEPGNAGAPNRSGDRAADFAFIGRTQVAHLIGAAASEIIFTSGATEANNIVLLGVTDALVRLNSGRRRIIVSAIEHKAVLEPAKALAAQGFHLDFAPVSPDGQLDIEAFLSLMGKNNSADARRGHAGQNKQCVCFVAQCLCGSRCHGGHNPKCKNNTND